jgi:hypothetical protein
MNVDFETWLCENEAQVAQFENKKSLAHETLGNKGELGCRPGR